MKKKKKNKRKHRLLKKMFLLIHKKQQFLDWEQDNKTKDLNAEHNFVDTDQALKYYNRKHAQEKDYVPSEPPQFSDYYTPSKKQKTGEMLYVGGGMLTLGYLASKMF